MSTQEPRIFKMIRNGNIVAYGCLFGVTGKCVVAWTGQYQSIVVWDSYDDLKNVNGHSDTKY